MRNLFIAVLLLALAELVVVVWFLYGQGYDRVSARIVIEWALLLIPVLAVGLMYIPRFQGATQRLFGLSKSWVARYARTLAACSILALAGIGLPALIVFGAVQPPGPFDELWMMLGGVVVVFGGLTYMIFQPPSARHWFALGYVCGAAAIQLGIKTLVFSIF